MDISSPAIEQRLTGFRQRCQERGLALTPQRLAIYQVLAGDDSHPNAETIFQRLKPAMPSLSLGTVYRTLELFEEQGLIVRIHAFDGQALFEANLEPHVHLICLGCRKIVDLHEPKLQRLSSREVETQGFEVVEARLQLLGYCQSCHGKKDA